MFFQFVYEFQIFVVYDIFLVFFCEIDLLHLFPPPLPPPLTPQKNEVRKVRVKTNLC